jgi:hypothetical protein
LPNGLNESSGIEIISSKNKIWSHNDSGGNPELYELDTLGNLLRTLTIANATNVDWEELTKDSLGNIYIGDCGNNSNNRTDLKFYIVPNPDNYSSNLVNAQIINFAYPDQHYFPPANSKMNFDCEASFIFHDSLYLFSKDRSSPYTGFSKLYRLPKNAGTYIAELLDSFCFGNSSVTTNSITSADILSDGSKMVLISHEEMWVFDNFFQHKYFAATYQHYLMGTSNAYKEGVVFVNQNELYLTDEKHSSKEGNLYRVDLSQTNTLAETIDNADGWSIYPNPVSTELRIRNYELRIEKAEVIDLLGRIELTQSIKNPTNQQIILDVSHLTSHIYILKLTDDKGLLHVVKFIKN